MVWGVIDFNRRQIINLGQGEILQMSVEQAEKYIVETDRDPRVRDIAGIIDREVRMRKILG